MNRYTKGILGAILLIFVAGCGPSVQQPIQQPVQHPVEELKEIVLTERGEGLAKAYLDQFEQEVKIARQHGYYAQMRINIKDQEEIIELGKIFLSRSSAEHFFLGTVQHRRSEIEEDIASRQNRQIEHGADLRDAVLTIDRMQDLLKELQQLAQHPSSSVTQEEAFRAHFVAFHRVNDAPLPKVGTSFDPSATIRKLRKEFDNRLRFLSKESPLAFNGTFIDWDALPISNFRWQEAIKVYKNEEKVLARLEKQMIAQERRDRLAREERERLAEEKRLIQEERERLSKMGNAVFIGQLDEGSFYDTGIVMHNNELMSDELTVLSLDGSQLRNSTLKRLEFVFAPAGSDFDFLSQRRDNAKYAGGLIQRNVIQKGNREYADGIFVSSNPNEDHEYMYILFTSAGFRKNESLSVKITIGR